MNEEQEFRDAVRRLAQLAEAGAPLPQYEARVQLFRALLSGIERLDARRETLERLERRCTKARRLVGRMPDHEVRLEVMSLLATPRKRR